MLARLAKVARGDFFRSLKEGGLRMEGEMIFGPVVIRGNLKAVPSCVLEVV